MGACQLEQKAIKPINANKENLHEIARDRICQENVTNIKEKLDIVKTVRDEIIRDAETMECLSKAIKEKFDELKLDGLLID